MSEFIEPEAGGDEILFPKPKVFSEEFLTSVIKKSIDSGDIQPGDKLTLVGIIDEKGAKAVLAVSILDRERVKIKFNALFEHDWDEGNKVGAKVIVSVK